MLAQFQEVGVGAPSCLTRHTTFQQGEFLIIVLGEEDFVSVVHRKNGLDISKTNQNKVLPNSSRTEV